MSRTLWIALLGLLLGSPGPSMSLPPFPMTVAWHIDAPCAFVGLLSEAIPVLIALDQKGLRLSLHLGEWCPLSFWDEILPHSQAEVIRRLLAPPNRHFRSTNERSVSRATDSGGAQHGLVVGVHDVDDQEWAQWSGARAPTGPYVEIRHGQHCALRQHVWDHPPQKVIGRLMTENTLIPEEQRSCLGAFDQVWVPTDWHHAVFQDAGVPNHKLQTMPEAINPIFDHGSGSDGLGASDGENQPFCFLSIFKWTWRKGWDVLLKAYWEEFSPQDPVVLHIHTGAPNSTFAEAHASDADAIKTLLQDHAMQIFGKDLGSLAPVRVSTNAKTALEMRELFQQSSAFVLPTRGEGWGLPVMEAMAMGLPTIVTGFSGVTAFAKDHNSFLLNFTVRDDGYAEPDSKHLRQLLRGVLMDRKTAAEKAQNATAFVVDSGAFSAQDIAEKANAALWAMMMQGFM